jgi:hypothetical protein
MPFKGSHILMKYTIIVANISIIIVVIVTMINGFLTIEDKDDFNSLSDKNSTIWTLNSNQERMTLIIDSIIKSIVAVLGLWAGIKEIFSVLIIYGIILVISIVISITLGLGVEQIEVNNQIQSNLIGVCLVIVGTVLALFAFRLACITKRGVDTVENEPDVQEEQNQCEIV